MTSESIIFQKTHEMPALLKKGIAITGLKENCFKKGQPVWINVLMAVEVEDHLPQTYYSKLKSVFVTVITQSNQVPIIGNLLKDYLFFSDDMRSDRLPDRTPVAVSTFDFDLTTVVETVFIPEETYYIQVSAQQYRSNILTLQCQA